MADNMMRIAARNEDGKAKAIKTDIKGNVKTKNRMPDIPFPARITPTLTPSASAPLPNWIDKDGYWWAHDLAVIKKGWYTAAYTAVLSNPRPGEVIQALMVSDTGRIICTFANGEVYASNPEQTAFTLAFTFPVGYSAPQYGHSKYKNIILIASYGAYSLTDSPRYLYASHDDGATFECIYTGVSKNQYHLHSVAYDPWADRIWLSEGDNPNSRLLYMDGYGSGSIGEWITVISFADSGVPFQPTSIMPTPYSVVFGSDTLPDGIAIWERPEGYFQPKVEASDIIWDYKVLQEGEIVAKELFVRGWCNIEDGEPLLVMAVAPMQGRNGFSRIIISNDGLNFHEIWKGYQGEPGIQWLTGPYSKDGKRLFRAAITIGTSTFLMEGKIPEFKNIESNPVIKNQATSKVKLDTLFNKSVVAGQATPVIDMGITNEKEVWIQINIDKFPWSLETTSNASPFAMLPASSSPVFPLRNNVAAAAPSASAPAISLFYATRADSNTGLTAPTNLRDAKENYQLPLPENALRVLNFHATDAAMITIKILRIWK